MTKELQPGGIVWEALHPTATLQQKEEARRWLQRNHLEDQAAARPSTAPGLLYVGMAVRVAYTTPEQEWVLFRDAERARQRACFGPGKGELYHLLAQAQTKPT